MANGVNKIEFNCLLQWKAVEVGLFLTAEPTGVRCVSPKTLYAPYLKVTN